MATKIKVAIRVRPLNEKELAKGDVEAWEYKQSPQPTIFPAKGFTQTSQDFKFGACVRDGVVFGMWLCL